MSESPITERQSFIMTEAEPGICVQGLRCCPDMRKQTEGWPKLGASIRCIWRRDVKDGNHWDRCGMWQNQSRTGWLYWGLSVPNVDTSPCAFLQEVGT